MGIVILNGVKNLDPDYEPHPICLREGRMTEAISTCSQITSNMYDSESSQLTEVRDCPVPLPAYAWITPRKDLIGD